YRVPPLTGGRTGVGRLHRPHPVEGSMAAATLGGNRPRRRASPITRSRDRVGSATIRRTRKSRTKPLLPSPLGEGRYTHTGSAVPNWPWHGTKLAWPDRRPRQSVSRIDGATAVPRYVERP